MSGPYSQRSSFSTQLAPTAVLASRTRPFRARSEGAHRSPTLRADLLSILLHSGCSLSRQVDAYALRQARSDACAPCCGSCVEVPRTRLDERDFIADSELMVPARVAAVLALLALTNACQEQPPPSLPDPPKAATEPREPVVSNPPKNPLAGLRVEQVHARFEAASVGRTTIDGGIWAPRVNVNVRNTGDTDIDVVYLRAIFVDSEKTLRGDPVIDRMVELPAGYAKGPATLRGEVGFTSNMVFFEWHKRPSLRWRFELFMGPSSDGPWSKVGHGLVDGIYEDEGEFVPEPSVDAGSVDIALPPSPPSVAAPTVGRPTNVQDVTGLATAAASSVLPPDVGMDFEAANLLDGRLETSWQPSAKRRFGVGEWFTLTLSAPKNVTALEIANGFQTIWRGQDLFPMNARLNEIEIELGGRTLRYVFPPDTRGYVTIPIEPPVLADRITVRALSVHRGTRWPDLVVSEVHVLAARP